MPADNKHVLPETTAVSEMLAGRTVVAASALGTGEVLGFCRTFYDAEQAMFVTELVG